MTLHLEVLPADAWADAVGQRLAQRLASPGPTRVCLPTGNTPRPAYRSFAEGGGRLDTAEVFLLDEFALPQGHPARCDGMLRRSLLDLVDTPPAAMHTFDTEAASIDDECTRYEGVVDAGGLDLTLLGLGANGHVGLNEPGSTEHSSTRRVELHAATIRSSAAYGSGPAPQWGVTLGMRPLLDSREIWLMVTGTHKAEILRRALVGPVGPDVPASYLQRHERTYVLADEEAARLLD